MQEQFGGNQEERAKIEIRDLYIEELQRLHIDLEQRLLTEMDSIRSFWHKDAFRFLANMASYADSQASCASDSFWLLHIWENPRLRSNFLNYVKESVQTDQGYESRRKDMKKILGKFDSAVPRGVNTDDPNRRFTDDELLDREIITVISRDDSCLAPSPHCSPAPVGSTIAVERSHAHQGCYLPAVQAPQLRQTTQQRCG